MTASYNLAYSLFGIFYLPLFLRRLKQAENPKKLLSERLGFWPNSTASSNRRAQKLIWIHAVSVGEVMAVKSFLEGFLNRFPGYQILLTTVTPTGQSVAKTFTTNPRVNLAYFPFDFTFSCRSFFRKWKPECVCLVETEIWPNFLVEAEKAQVPVGIINARLSEKSAGRYGKARTIFRPLFEQLSFVLAQTREDAARFIHLGVSQDRVETLGNIKFDNVQCAPEKFGDDFALRTKWGFNSEDKIWILGSTHPGE